MAGLEQGLAWLVILFVVGWLAFSDRSPFHRRRR
jgi:hypothetical protein